MRLLSFNVERYLRSLRRVEVELILEVELQIAIIFILQLYLIMPSAINGCFLYDARGSSCNAVGQYAI